MSHICHNCIDERVLKAEMRTNGEQAPCDWCKRNARGLSAERLADRVAPVFEAVVGPAEEGFRMTGGRPDWGPLGRSPVELMTDLVLADDDGIASELVAILAGRNHWRGAEGSLDYYDDTSDYLDFIDPSHGQVRSAWTRFCESLRHESRFFTSQEALDVVLRPLLQGSLARKAIRQIRPGEAKSTIYRGRLAHDVTDQNKIYSRPRSGLSASPRGGAGTGRMNAAGISVFYGAFDVNTCLAELRAPVGGAAIVGRFEVIRPLRVLDLSRLESLHERLSCFEQNYVDRHSYLAFIRSFHSEVRRVVIPGRESLDYLPTQAVAEYLWTKVDPPIDGLIFGSAQISGSHKNIVLFPHACQVEGAENEQKRTVRSTYNEGPTEDDTERAAVTRVFLKPLPAPAPHEEPVPGSDDVNWFSAGLDLAAARPNELAPSLRLAADGLSLVKVEAIRMKSTSRPIKLEEWNEVHDF